MGKLHELLAVEDDLKNIYMASLKEAEKDFKNKVHLFIGFHRHLDMIEDGYPSVPDDQQQMTTTVNDKLDYVFEKGARYIDAVVQKESTNQLAVADVIVDGKTIAEKVPATFLLGMEAKLKTIRDVLLQIPTLPAGVECEKDETLGTYVYKRKNPEVKMKTAKTFQHKVLYEATDKHPAQIEKWEETKDVGKFIKDMWFGLPSPADKAAILTRVDKLYHAVKKARQKANNIEVNKINIGKDFFDYILNGIA